MPSRFTEEELDVVRQLIDERVASILSSHGLIEAPASPASPEPPPPKHISVKEWRAIVLRCLDTLRHRLGTSRPFELAEARGIVVRQVELSAADLEKVGKRERWVGQFQNAIDPKMWRQSPFAHAEGRPRGWYRLRTSTEIAQLRLLDVD